MARSAGDGGLRPSEDALTRESPAAGATAAVLPSAQTSERRRRSFFSCYRCELPEDGVDFTWKAQTLPALVPLDSAPFCTCATGERVLTRETPRVEHVLLPLTDCR